MINYCLGLVFNQRGVLLVMKARGPYPGMMNGFGGVIHPSFSAKLFMTVKLLEEAGVNIGQDRWSNVARIEGDKWMLRVYQATATDEELGFAKKRDPHGDPIHWVPLNKIDTYPCAPHLRWLIAAANESHLDGPVKAIDRDPSE